jgi:hypothetical protein
MITENNRKPRAQAGEEMLQYIEDSVHNANEAIRVAVDAGLSVELVRISRYHDGAGSWGDQLSPAIRENPWRN